MKKLIVFIFLGLVTPSFTFAWWNPNWTSRQKITLNNSSSSVALTNFPILVLLNSGRINYAKTQDAGQDIRFVDADDTTTLNYEIDRWNEAATSSVWVQVPSV